MSSFKEFLQVVTHFHNNDRDNAALAAKGVLEQSTAVAEEERFFFQCMFDFLNQKHNSTDLYSNAITSDGFNAFVNNGGNVPLYVAVNEHFFGEFQERGANASLLDIGCGGGAHMVEALKRSPAVFSQITLVDPSPMLADCVAAVSDIVGDNTTLVHHNGSVQHFCQTLSEQHFSLAISAFCLHNLMPAERAQVFASLASVCDELLVLEFDVPESVDFAVPLADATVRYFYDTYRHGVLEYRDADQAAIDHFLMPILFKNFVSDKTERIFEQSSDAWRKELQPHFTTVSEPVPVCDYWWANCFALKCAK